MAQPEHESDDAGITEAWNEAGKIFLVRDINDPDIYAAYLHQQVLRDELLREVVAVRKSTRNKAYFRLRPEYQDGTRIDRGENDPLHDGTVLRLHKQLLEADSLEVRTTHWQRDGASTKAVERTLWRSKSFRKLTWKCDPLTRVWLDRSRYFQPDLCGFDPVAAYAGPNNPWLIIEVVHHHWPEEAAWAALVALSKANHLVLFYFVKDGERDNWVNKTFGGQAFVIKVTYYLLDGELYENSTRIAAPVGTSNSAAWIKLNVLARKDATLLKELTAKKRQRNHQD